MKRRHLRADAIEMCRRAREYRPDIAFGADIIAGFPTETDEMFQNTLDIVEECDLTFLHIFPYSEREGTPAAKMPQVEQAIRKARAKLLREAGKVQLQKLLRNNLNKEVQVVVEKGNNGRSENFSPVKLSGDLSAGSLVTVRTTAIDGDFLRADVL